MSAQISGNQTSSYVGVVENKDINNNGYWLTGNTYTFQGKTNTIGTLLLPVMGVPNSSSCILNVTFNGTDGTNQFQRMTEYTWIVNSTGVTSLLTSVTYVTAVLLTGWSGGIILNNATNISSSSAQISLTTSTVGALGVSGTLTFITSSINAGFTAGFIAGDLLSTSTSGTLTVADSGIPSAWLNQALTTTSSPTFVNELLTGDLFMGATSTTTLTGAVVFAPTIQIRKIVLFPLNDNDNQTYAIGIAGGVGVMRFTIPASTNQYVFFSGSTSTTATTLFSILGNGSGVSIPPNSTNASYDIGSGMGTFAVVTSAGAYFVGSIVGDVVFRSASKRILLGNVGTSVPSLIIAPTETIDNTYIVGGLAAPTLTPFPITCTAVNSGGSQKGGTIFFTTTTTIIAGGLLLTAVLPLALPNSTYAVIVSAANTAAASIGLYATPNSPTAFNISCTGNLPITTQFNINWMVVT